MVIATDAFIILSNLDLVIMQQSRVFLKTLAGERPTQYLDM